MAAEDARYILSIDQGTTSTRALLFDASGSPMRVRQKELRQIFPQDGWVEHDAAEIWAATLEVCRGVLTGGTTAANIAAIGITNQRETTVLWERATGKPLHNAIVWQDRRTAALCAKLKAEGAEAIVQAKTGCCSILFSGTSSRGCSTMCRMRAAARRRRPLLRHHRCVADFQSDRRQGACDGCDERVADAALQHRQAGMGRGNLSGSTFRRRCCRR